MYPHVKTTNTCACINAIASSKPEKAIINDRGNKPKTKNKIPDVIILKVNPLNIFNSICS